MYAKMSLILILTATTAHAASPTFNAATFQQQTFTATTVAPRTATFSPTISPAVTPVIAPTTFQAITPIKTAVFTPTFTSTTLQNVQLTTTPQIKVATVSPITQLQPVKVTPTLQAIKLDAVKTVTELTLDAASLASVALQPVKSALPAPNLDPTDAARLAVNNENLVPAAKVVTNGTMVVLVDEREERRKAMAAQDTVVPETRAAPRVAMTAASRRDSLAKTVARAPRLGTSRSTAKRLTDSTLPR